MQPLIEIPTGELLASGLFPGLKGMEPILWSDGENVVFDQGKVKKSRGYVGLGDLATRMRGAKPWSTLTEPRLLFGGGGAYYRYRTADGITALKTGLSGDGNWIFAPYGEHFVACDGVNGIRYYDSADTAVSTPFSNARGIFPIRQQIVAFNTSNGVNWLEWCDIDNAKTGWTPSLSNAAGNLQPRDFDGEFVAAHALTADVVAVYTRGMLGHFSYVGGSLLYGCKPKVPGAGACSHYSVVPVGNKHYSIMPNRIISTDGITFDFIDSPAVRSYMDANVNWSRAQEIYGWHDRLNSMVRWVIPTSTSAYFGLGYNYSTRRWTRFNDGVLLGTESGVWDNAMLLTSGRLLRGDPMEEDSDSGALASYIQTKPLHCGSREVNKVVDKVVLDLTKSGTVQFQIGFSDDANDTPTFTETTYTAVDGDNWLEQDENRTGCFVTLKISSSGVGNDWELGSFSLHGEFGGLKN